MRSISKRTIRDLAEREVRKYAKEHEEEIAFEIYKRTTTDTVRQTEALVLYALSLHGYGGERLRRIHAWVVEALAMGEMMGRKADTAQVQQYIAEKYGIEFEETVIDLAKEKKEAYK